MVKYIPKQGDIITIDFTPTKGSEQKGFRPAIVISNHDFNYYTKMIIVLPITSNIKSFPTHYILKNTRKIKGAVLCEHVRSFDFEAKNIKYIEDAADTDLKEIKELFNACID